VKSTNYEALRCITSAILIERSIVSSSPKPQGSQFRLVSLRNISWIL